MPCRGGLAGNGITAERWSVAEQWPRLERARPEIQRAVVHGGRITHAGQLIARIKTGMDTMNALVNAGFLEKSMARRLLHPRAVWLN